MRTYVLFLFLLRYCKSSHTLSMANRNSNVLLWLCNNNSFHPNFASWESVCCILLLHYRYSVCNLAHAAVFNCQKICINRKRHTHKIAPLKTLIPRNFCSLFCTALTFRQINRQVRERANPITHGCKDRHQYKLGVTT